MHQQILQHAKNVHRRVGKKFKPMLTPVCCKKLKVPFKLNITVNHRWQMNIKNCREMNEHKIEGGAKRKTFALALYAKF